jgi:hypothetical protein
MLKQELVCIVKKDQQWFKAGNTDLLQIGIKPNTGATRELFPFEFQIHAIEPQAKNTSNQTLISLLKPKIERCCRVQVEMESNTLITARNESGFTIAVKTAGIKKILQYLSQTVVTVPDDTINGLIAQLEPEKSKRKAAPIEPPPKLSRLPDAVALGKGQRGKQRGAIGNVVEGNLMARLRN